MDRVTQKITLAMTRAVLESYFFMQDRRSRVAVEGMGNWMSLCETIEEYTLDVVLAPSEPVNEMRHSPVKN